MAISAVTLAELSAGPHEVRRNDEHDLYDEHEERARRTETLQRAESEFDPVPFDAEAARTYGRVTAAVVAAGRKPRRRITDLMIAATAIAVARGTGSRELFAAQRPGQGVHLPVRA
jgi:predicted nucleic acid-binding protein